MGDDGEFRVRLSRPVRGPARRLGLAVRCALHPRTGRGPDCTRLNYVRHDCENFIEFILHRQVPCTHALLAKWIPPNERSRMGAFVYAGAQFGTVISMPLSGLLAEYGFAGGWPSIFYVFGTIGTIWCVVFLWTCKEDPQSDETIEDDERKYIVNQLWGSGKMTSPPIPWRSIMTSMPFFAILLAQ